MLASVRRSRHRLLVLSFLPPAATSHSRSHAAALFSFSPIPSPKPHSPYSSTTSANPTDAHRLTFAYLVTACGLSNDAAASAARKISMQSTANADAVRALLKNHGLSDAHISKMVRKFPNILVSNPYKFLEPKLEFFVRFGFSGSTLARLLSKQPILLLRRIEQHLVPCMDFFRGILHTDERIISAFSYMPRVLTFNVEKTMRPALRALQALGLPEDTVARMVQLEPGVLTLSPARINEAAEVLKAAGLRLTDPKVINGFRILALMRQSKWERMMALFRSFGFSENDVFSILLGAPTSMALSEETAGEKLRFFLDGLKFSHGDIVKSPKILTVSLEKAVIPRCAVLSVLIGERKIAAEYVNLSGFLQTSSKNFMERYVSKYQDDVPDVVKAYNGEIGFNGFGDQSVGFGSKSRRRSSSKAKELA